MRKSKNIKRRTAAQYKNLKCQNSDPDTSKYAKFAPLDGPCTEVVNVPDEVTRVLCFKCTSRSATGK
jgi:negative regulator of sigma E activity